MRAFPRFAPLTVVALAIVLSGCGQNNLTPLVGPTATSTPTATVPHTATSTIPPAPTATAAPSFTSTRVPIPTLTATQTVTSPPTQSATATVSPTPAAAMLMFNADATNPQNPFPSDRLIGSDGHVHLPATYLQINAPRTPEFQLAFAYADLAASQLSELTGFGTFAPLRIRFDRPMTVDMGSNPRGVYVLEYNDLAGKPAVVTATAYDPDNSIEIQPVVPFKPKTTYALILTTDITDGNGNHIMPSPDFTKLLAGTDLSPDLAAWRSKLQPVIDFAANNLDINQQALALVDLFTTLPTTDDLVAIEHRLATGNLVPGMPVFDQPLGNLQTGIFPEGSAGYADLIGAPTSPNVSEVAIGYFESYDFRTGPKGGFDPAKVNGPTVPGTNKVDFYMTIPKAPKPPGGYPIVIFGHGLGGSGRDVARIADLGIDLPVVGIAISALQHGRRGTVTNFFVLNDIATTREYFRQTVADTLQEYRMIKEAHAAGIAPFDQ
ncbi:MAG TPA: Ig-like domain-containing protein, partial [Candidatus Acidoferrales bacterium]|nr:Ig-like domain-containing protein [Candidatus Acidoferrales bacterium]